MQLKFKPSMIIQEMQRDKNFMRSTQQDINSNFDDNNHLRKRTITDKDFEKIAHKSIESEIVNPRTVKKKHGKSDLILNEESIQTLRNLRLDSRINPRKSIVLDISIMDKRQEGPKSVKNRNSQVLNHHNKVSISL
jgi:hypothetical protein